MNIGIYGTGVFGLALSSIFTDNGCNITMWTKFKDEKDELIKNKGSKMLPNYNIGDNITITNSLDEVAKDKDLLVIAIPVVFIEDTLKNANIKDGANILVASKGITNDKLLVSELIGKYVNANVAVLSGPTFASDVVLKKPISFTIATLDENLKRICMLAFKNNYVKLQYSNDLYAIEFLGAIKNVYAIISGLLDGLGATKSTKALFLTDAIRDEEAILESLDCLRDDALSYAGVGDLILTCSSSDSRNYSFGKILGESGISASKDFLKNNTVEGYQTISNIAELVIYDKINSKLLKCLVNILNGVSSKEDIFNVLVTN